MEEGFNEKDELYVLYEERLIRRDVLKKEAFQYRMEYIRTFGDLMAKVFEAKISCIEKKKIIAYCQKKVNRGEKIRRGELDQYMKRVMHDYYDQLQDLLKIRKDAEKKGEVSDYDYRKIKSTYYKIAKLIHPDMSPQLADDETISDYWVRAMEAYQCNDLKELEELYVMINSYLQSIGHKHQKPDYPDIVERVDKLDEEIGEIIRSEPYVFKFLLSDQQAVEEKKKKLQDELDEYLKYADELDEIIAQFKMEGLTA